MTPTTALLILAWIAIVLLALALGGVVAQLRALHATITRRPTTASHTPVVGILIDQDGRTVAPPYIALFVTPDCSTCKTVTPAAVRAAADRTDKTAPVFVVSDQPYSSNGFASMNSVHRIVEADAAEHFGIPAFPWLVAVASDGSVVDHSIAHDPDDVATRIRNASTKERMKKGATT